MKIDATTFASSVVKDMEAQGLSILEARKVPAKLEYLINTRLMQIEMETLFTDWRLPAQSASDEQIAQE